MIRAVFDTNIVVSALLWGGLPREALNAVRLQRFLLLTSEDLLAELSRVLARPKFAMRLAEVGRTPENLVEDYRLLVDLIEPARIQPVIEADPKDDIVLACALSGKANYIVSGDHHLLDLIQYANIPVLKVDQFHEKLQEQ